MKKINDILSNNKYYMILFIVFWTLFAVQSFFMIHDFSIMIKNSSVFKQSLDILNLRMYVSLFTLYLCMYPFAVFIACYFSGKTAKYSLLFLPLLVLLFCNRFVISLWELPRNHDSTSMIMKTITNSPNAFYLLLLLPILAIAIYKRKQSKIFTFSILISSIFIIVNFLYHFGVIYFWQIYELDKQNQQVRILENYASYSPKEVENICYINQLDCIYIKNGKIDNQLLKDVGISSKNNIQKKVSEYVIKNNLNERNHYIVLVQNREARVNLNIYPYLASFYLDYKNNGILISDKYYKDITINTGTVLNAMLLTVYLLWIIFLTILLNFHEKRLYFKNQPSLRK